MNNIGPALTAGRSEHRFSRQHAYLLCHAATVCRVKRERLLGSDRFGKALQGVHSPRAFLGTSFWALFMSAASITEVLSPPAFSVPSPSHVTVLVPTQLFDTLTLDESVFMPLLEKLIGETEFLQVCGGPCRRCIPCFDAFHR